MTGVSQDLIDRIKLRLEDDWRRTGAGDWQRTPRELRRRNDAPASPVGALLQTVLDTAFDRAALHEPAKAPPPVEPMSEKAIAKVEAQLGFRLPEALRQLYAEVTDGNFGPYFGIRRLGNWAKDYLKLRETLEAERGHAWPEALLPLVFLNGRRVCLDRRSGEVVFWDRPAKRCSRKKWDASFVVQTATLEEWLERWVDTPTVCMGGPAGGWTASEAETARRSEVADIRAKREAKVAERAARVDFGTFAPLDDELLPRIAQKAGHPDRRTSGAEALEGSQPLDLDALIGEFEGNSSVDPEVRRQLGGMARGAGMLARMFGMGSLRVSSHGGAGFTMGFESSGGELGRPASRSAIADAEKALGFALPEPLRQLYDLADGGFGPGDAGLMPLKKLAKDYSRRTATPQGPNDEPWPARHLPLTNDGPQVWCFNLEDGSIVCHDLEEMDGFGHGQWQKSFVREAGSVAEWFEGWLGAKTLRQQVAEATAAACQARGNSPVTGFPMQLDNPADQAEGEIAFLDHSPELRRDFGLPEFGWQDEIRRRHGLA